jgi:GTP cyclohydrolase II
MLMIPSEVARARLPTTFGTFDLRAFRCPSGFVYLALVAGEIGDGSSVLTRVHSECLTGDALGSLRCDCGVQLRWGLRAVAAEGRGIVLYATGHEGRGIGLIDKLRAYVEQDRGADTVDANLHLGLPVDGRDYGEAASVLAALGVRSIRLITNNPRKTDGLQQAGIEVESVRHLPVAAHLRTVSYLNTKQERLGHVEPMGADFEELLDAPPDVAELLGEVRPHNNRPYTIIKYAQSMDGRIATAGGDAAWISGMEERKISHALRARCDAILVGAGTVLSDDPQLTVRLVPGQSPMRVILDSALRIPVTARALSEDAPTLVITTDRSDPHKRRRLRDANVAVKIVPASNHGVDIQTALALLYDHGVESLLVEGGARVITTLLGAGHVDRMIVAFAPLILGRGIEAVGDLGTARVAHGLELTNRIVHLAGDDVMVAWDFCAEAPGSKTARGNGLAEREAVPITRSR